MNPLKQILKYVLSAGIAAACVVFLAGKVEWKVFWEDLLETRWIYMILFAAVSVLAIIFRTIRWKMLLNTADKDISALRIWDAINIGNVVNVILPGLGELVRCGIISKRRGKEKIGFNRVFYTIVAERAWDLVAIAALLILALICNIELFGGFLKEHARVSNGIILGAGLALAILGLAISIIVLLKDKSEFFGKAYRALDGFVHGTISALNCPRKGEFALWTIAIWGSYILLSFFAIKAVPALESLGMEAALFISTVGNIAAVIPVPSGVGPYHYLTTLVLGTIYGTSNEVGILCAVLQHESHAIIVLALGLLSWISTLIQDRK